MSSIEVLKNHLNIIFFYRNKNFKSYFIVISRSQNILVSNFKSYLYIEKKNLEKTFYSKKKKDFQTTKLIIKIILSVNSRPLKQF